ncbi:MAG: Rpn family recombination-promoting nuclease/putative transposase [Thermoflexibacteraceae bacterium]
MIEKFINPFTDFGFKKIFGEEANKDLLIDFLNELLPSKGKIIQLTYLQTEQLGATQTDRKAIFDLYCQNDKGEKFIIELQKAKQNYFKDRSLYYSTFAIQEQATQGEWDFQLQGVYTIALMDFTFDDQPSHQHIFRHDVQLMEVNRKEVFYDKLVFVYLEMPKFTKSLNELTTQYEKWLFLLKNLPLLDTIPEQFKEKAFRRLFEIASIANYNETEKRAYQTSLKYYRDLKNTMDTKFEEGLLEGVEIGKKEGVEIGKKEGIELGEKNAKLQIARNLKAAGATALLIQQATGLSLKEIESL